MRSLCLLSWSAFALAGLFSLLVEGGLLGAPVTPDLGAWPARLGPLEVLEEIPIEPGALGETPPERHAFLRVRLAGAEGKLFAAYYERAQRWSGRPHDVERCYAALGWEEREAHQLDEAHRPWSRRFEREGEAIRVVHWLEHPGVDSDALGWRGLAARLGSARGFRQDVAALYLEFPAEGAPADGPCLDAVTALEHELETRW